MNVLVACEESQRVCIAFREKGHNAFSCDIQECSGGHPEWHIRGDVTAVLNGNCFFTTEGGATRGDLWSVGSYHCTSSVHVFEQCRSLQDV